MALHHESRQRQQRCWPYTTARETERVRAPGRRCQQIPPKATPPSRRQTPTYRVATRKMGLAESSRGSKHERSRSASKAVTRSFASGVDNLRHCGCMGRATLALSEAEREPPIVRRIAHRPLGLGRGYSAGAVKVGGASSCRRAGSEPGATDPRRTSACSRRCSSACSSAARRSAWNHSSADRRLCTWLRTGASRVSTTCSPGASPGVFVSSRCNASSVTRPNGPGMYPGPDRDRSGLGSSSKKSGSPVNGTTRTDARVDPWCSMEASVSSSTNGSTTRPSTSWVAQSSLNARISSSENTSAALCAWLSQPRSESSSGCARNSSLRTGSRPGFIDAAFELRPAPVASDRRSESRSRSRSCRSCGAPLCMLFVIVSVPSCPVSGSTPKRTRREPK